MEQRVDLHELNTRRVEYSLARDFGQCSFQSSAAGRIAIHDRIGEDFTAGRNQPEIDAPGVHADPRQFAAKINARFPKPDLQFIPQRQ